MPAIKDINIVKIAVEMEDQVPQLIEFDQKRPLAAIILDLCQTWGLADPDQYALQFSDSAHNYITEKNRNEIKNGSVLRLTFSSTKTAQEILEKLNFGTEEDKKVSLRRLSRLSSDYTFALEFINKQGSNYLIEMIEGGNFEGEILSLTLLSFVELMDHGIVSWDNLQDKFVHTVANQVNSQSSTDPRALQASLAILESLVLNSFGKYPLVEQEVTLLSLISHLQSTLPEIQQNSIALINALFLKADRSKRRTVFATLTKNHIRNIIFTHIIRTQHVGSEMAHQLYVLQTLIFNLLEEKMKALDPQDPEARDKILELRKIAFDTGDLETANTVGRKGGGYSKDYKKLGFRNYVNPAEDFAEIPPGMLALENMIYFARNHTETYVKVVLENCRSDEHECPFGRAGIELTKLLCEILKVSEPPTEQGKQFYPMFFTNDNPFEEFFSICIVRLNQTWKEMRAATEDFSKVMSVVRAQISRALTDPIPHTLDKFKSKLATLTYNEITNIWQKERSNREDVANTAKPIVQLRQLINPEILSLVQKQRMQYLCSGTLFTKYSNKGQRIKDKFWYCRLSPNLKQLHYGDVEENRIPPLEDLPHKLPVVEIKALVTGKECPHMKEVKRTKSSTLALAFSIVPDSELEPVNFVAPNEKDFDYWTDGLNALLGNSMTSKETQSEMEILLSMDISLRLLDTENVDIPETPPSIPKDPPNYDFCYDFK